jgi:outer membrane protein assembly factor BamD
MTRFLQKTALAGLAVLAASCGFHHKKYDNPITKDTQQPDKVLFDKATKDIEKGRYEVARLTLNTLINTYDTSEFLAKAKLAVADSWFREGGARGLSQAEAEYKDFILFYPTMEEAAESQQKICDIHFKQMDKADRDENQALRAEQECRQLLVQFPNSKFAPSAEQRLREIQEVLADSEYSVGHFYHKRGALAAASNRLGALVDQYPLYSGADLALWEEADAFERMGPRFRKNAGETYQKLVKEYPLSSYADQAKKKLKGLEMEVPEADPAAVARMKFEAENRTRNGMLHKATGFIRRNPDTNLAAKSGTPAMENIKPSLPANVQLMLGAQEAAANGTNDVTIGTVPATGSALDTKQDARTGGAPPVADVPPPGKPAAGTAASTTPASGAAATTLPADKDPTVTPDPKSKKKQPRKPKKNSKTDKTDKPAVPGSNQ